MQLKNSLIFTSFFNLVIAAVNRINNETNDFGLAQLISKRRHKNRKNLLHQKKCRSQCLISSPFSIDYKF